MSEVRIKTHDMLMTEEELKNQVLADAKDMQIQLRVKGTAWRCRFYVGSTVIKRPS